MTNDMSLLSEEEGEAQLKKYFKESTKADYAFGLCEDNSMIPIICLKERLADKEKLIGVDTITRWYTIFGPKIWLLLNVTFSNERSFRFAFDMASV